MKKSKFGHIIFRMFAKERAIRAAIAAFKAGDKDGSGNTSRGIISNPTESAALRRICEVNQITLQNGEVIRYPEKWLVVIDRTYAALNDDAEREILRAKVRGTYYVKVCALHNVSHGKFYNIVNRSYNFALAAACQMGLLRVI